MSEPFKKTPWQSANAGPQLDYQRVNLIKSLAGTVHPKVIARQLNRSYESIRQMAKREHISLRRV
ncbi:hypothetical protein [Cronobacter sakazakii]|uniref:hypothetical protein n=1 Tax=Cronobacter sakazakii TaxID=28141 RepID=UPI001EFC4700|nr:hypothetical protein [Cronobacter sakazakii]